MGRCFADRPGETLELRVKQYRGVVFIGLRGPAGIGPADLFVSVPGGPICQLHRSAQLAVAIVLPSGELPQLRKFGFSPNWYANELRWDIAEAERQGKAGKTPLEAMRAAWPRRIRRTGLSSRFGNRISRVSAG